MKIKLTYDSTDCWTQTKTVTTQDNLSENDVQALFQVELGVLYNEHECAYEVVGDGHVYTMAEVYAYSE